MVDIYKEALLFSNFIFNRTPITKKWAIINVALDIRQTFLLEGYSQIPTIYGYQCDDLPEYLIENGVVLAAMPNRWYVGKSKITEDECSSMLKGVEDSINQLAWSQGYYKEDERAVFYEALNPDGSVSYGPMLHGQSVILVSMEGVLNYTGEHMVMLNMFLGHNEYPKVVKLEAPGLDELANLEYQHSYWSEDFVQKGEKFVFGDIGEIRFEKPRDRITNQRLILTSVLFQNHGRAVSSKTILECIVSEAKANSELELIKIRQSPHNQISKGVFEDTLRTTPAKKDPSKKMSNFVEIRNLGSVN